MTLYVFDLGNTRLKFAPVSDAGALQDVIALAHGDADFWQRLEASLPARIDVAYVASVAPPALRGRFLEFLAMRCGLIQIARTCKSCRGLHVAYDDPSQLGVDRFLSMLYFAGSDRAQLLVSVGTALTVDLLLPGGEHRGGLIAPSPDLAREALHWRVPVLPEHGGSTVKDGFAASTVDALANGAYWGAVALIQRQFTAAQVHYPQLDLRLHGGGAAALSGEFPQALPPEPNLVLRGLAKYFL